MSDSDFISEIVNGIVDESLSDEQVIRWLREVFENGLDEKMTITLTESMRDSGEVQSFLANQRFSSSYSGKLSDLSEFHEVISDLLK